MSKDTPELHACPFCPESFGSYQALNAHKGQKHDSRVTIECEVCGESFSVVQSEEDSRRTCSRECLSVVQSGEFSGSGNPNYKDSVDTDELVAGYEEGMTSPELAKEFELSRPCVLDRLRAAECDVRDAGWPKRVETTFGLSVRSHHERDVAEALHGAGIEFEYEPSNFPGPYIPDFVLESGTVIEVWGVDGDEYDEHRVEKEDWYDNNGYALMGVIP